MEGVMMKAPEAWGLAVRLPDGQIHVERHEEVALTVRYPWARLPLLRGVVALIDALSISYKSLARSSELAGEEQETVSRPVMYGTMLISLLIGVGLFVVLPAFLASLIVSRETSTFLFYLVSGIIEAGILVIYLMLIGRFPDIRRYFMYHGAEHKAIAAYEKGLELTVENVRAQSAYHPRCGTSFIAFTAVIGIVIHSAFLPQPSLEAWYWILARLALVPVVAAVAFELLRFSATHRDPFSAAFRWLGFQFQMLTVKEPTDPMIEVAIASTQAALNNQPSQGTSPLPVA